MTLMVTRPDAAGPGGGGMCVVFDAKTGKGEAIDFLPRAPKSVAPAGKWRAASPGSFRGLFALHSRYGNLRWEQLVFPAERLARFGVKIPRGLTKILAGPVKSAIKDDQVRALFFDAAGKPLREGDVLRQVDLAVTLGRIRIAGPGDFYNGPLARRFVDGIQRAGGWLNIDDLRGYRPIWVAGKPAKAGSNEIYFLPAPAVGGEVSAEIWRRLGGKNNFFNVFSQSKSSEGKIAPGIAKATRESFSVALVKPRDLSPVASVGALAIDRNGNSAACVLSMDRPFGSGRMAGDTGVIPVRPARAGALLALSAVIVANPNTNQTYMAATGAGDQFASSAVMGVILRILEGKDTVEGALNAPRSASAVGRKEAFVEAKTSDATKAVLGEDATQVKEVARIGQVNVMWCPEGVETDPALCIVRSDPRGFGHAINAEF
jgi:gamma-glutamyltranspeptidase/glutathione hydrolase